MIRETAFAVVGLLFLLSALRSALSSLHHSLSLGLGLPDAVVTGIALAIFSTSLLALAASRRGPLRSVAITAAILVGGTLLGALSRAQWADLPLHLIALAGGLCWLTLFHTSRPVGMPSPLPTALPLALACDLVLRAGFSTLSVVDLPLIAAFAIVLFGALLLVALGLALPREREWTAPGWRGAVGLAALPSVVFIADTVGANPTRILGAGGLGVGPEGPGSTELATLGCGLAIGSALIALSRTAPRRPAVLASLAVALGAALLWGRVPIASTLGGFVLCAGCVLALAWLPSAPLLSAGSPLRATLAFGAGWIAYLCAAFASLALHDDALALLASTALVVVALLVVPAERASLRAPLALGAAVVVVLAPLISLIAVPAALEAPAPAALRVMTYNVNQGFNADHVVDVAALLQTIAQESPDVVVLQEVSRGRIWSGRHDLLTLLAEGLGMRYAFGPEIGDAYGNAILTRLSLRDVERIHLPGGGDPHGAIAARVGGLLVIGTRLDERRNPAARTAQLREVIGLLNGRSPALIVGDLGALPDALELALLTSAGLTDLALASGAREPTYPAGQPALRVDYAWGIGVSATQAHTVASTASDHRPLVLNVSAR